MPLALFVDVIEGAGDNLECVELHVGRLALHHFSDLRIHVLLDILLAQVLDKLDEQLARLIAHCLLLLLKQLVEDGQQPDTEELVALLQSKSQIEEDFIVVGGLEQLFDVLQDLFFVAGSQDEDDDGQSTCCVDAANLLLVLDLLFKKLPHIFFLHLHL